MDLRYVTFRKNQPQTPVEDWYTGILKIKIK